MPGCPRIVEERMTPADQNNAKDQHEDQLGGTGKQRSPVDHRSLGQGRSNGVPFVAPASPTSRPEKTMGGANPTKTRELPGLEPRTRKPVGFVAMQGLGRQMAMPGRAGGLTAVENWTQTRAMRIDIMRGGRPDVTNQPGTAAPPRGRRHPPSRCRRLHPPVRVQRSGQSTIGNLGSKMSFVGLFMVGSASSSSSPPSCDGSSSSFTWKSDSSS